MVRGCWGIAVYLRSVFAAGLRTTNRRAGKPPYPTYLIQEEREEEKEGRVKTTRGKRRRDLGLQVPPNRAISLRLEFPKGIRTAAKVIQKQINCERRAAWLRRSGTATVPHRVISYTNCCKKEGQLPKPYKLLWCPQYIGSYCYEIHHPIRWTNKLIYPYRELGREMILTMHHTSHRCKYLVEITFIGFKDQVIANFRPRKRYLGAVYKSIFFSENEWRKS